MKIEKIKRIGKKYKIILDNGLEIITYDDVVINNNLLYNKLIDDALINKINRENIYYVGYNKTLDYISKKFRSEKEINEYLDKNNISNKEKIIKKLKKVNLINDLNFVKAYISDRINLSNDGTVKIEQDLLKHNIPLDIIETELSKIDDNLIEKKITRLISKKIKNSKYTGYKLKYKVVNELINLGYDKYRIIEIYDKFYVKNDDLIIEEYNKLYNKLSKKYNGNELEKKIYLKLYNKGFTNEEIESVQKTNQYNIYND